VQSKLSSLSYVVVDKERRRQHAQSYEEGSEQTDRQASRLIGKQVYAVRKDGSVATGKLVRIQGDRMILQPTDKGKKVRTKAIIPLVLFDLLAIGTAPIAFGGCGGGPGFGAPFGYW